MIRVILISMLALFPVVGFCDNLSLLGLNNMSKPSASDATYVAKNAIGIGAFYEKTFSPTYALEIGLLDVARKYQNSGATQQYTQKMIEIPAMFRLYLNTHFSMGLGGYFSFFNGDYKTDDLTGAPSSTMSYGQAGLTKSDYGAVSSLAYCTPISEKFQLVGEVRDDVGIKNNRTDTSLPKLHVNDVQLFLGARLDL